MAVQTKVLPKPILDWFRECEFAVVAFSGGVDSSLVAYLARIILGEEKSLAVISDSPSLKRSDLAQAVEFCRRYGVPLRVITTREMDDKNYVSNPSDRCFYCKHALYSELREVLDEFPNGRVLNGTNLDDLGDYRPGLMAASRFRVYSPLSDCGLDKAAVRRLASALGLICWDKPASPCLSSRIAYGQPVTRAKLEQIEEAEALLNRNGFPVVRFRHFGREARIEVPVEDLSRLNATIGFLEPAILALGFDLVSVDQEGFVSGKLNREIGIEV